MPLTLNTHTYNLHSNADTDPFVCARVCTCNSHMWALYRHSHI